jgi:SNF2 family DNA or RNA helicase
VNNISSFVQVLSAIPKCVLSHFGLFPLDIDSKPILTLPPVDTKTIMVEFTHAERQFYDALHRKSLTLFEGFMRAGTASKSWLAIFSLLHRLRQTCDHVALTVKSHLDQDEWSSNIAASSEESTEKQKKSKDTGSIDQQVKSRFCAPNSSR